MYDDGSSQFASELGQNIPNSSLMMLMYTPVFGNMGFTITPASKGKIQAGYNTVPYLSEEAVLYNGQMSNPMSSPNMTYGGASSGQQVIASSQTTNDSTGIPRALNGTQQS